MNIVLNFKFELNYCFYIRKTIQSIEAIYRPISLSMYILYVMFFDIPITTQLVELFFSKNIALERIIVFIKYNNID